MERKDWLYRIDARFRGYRDLILFFSSTFFPFYPSSRSVEIMDVFARGSITALVSLPDFRV